MLLAWKVRKGHLIIVLSVCNSVSPAYKVQYLKCGWWYSEVHCGHLLIWLLVQNSVLLTNKAQYLEFGWWYCNQTWTVSSSKGCSHSPEITCPWGWGGVRMLGFEILLCFDFVAAGGIHLHILWVFLFSSVSLQALWSLLSCKGYRLHIRWLTLTVTFILKWTCN